MADDLTELLQAEEAKRDRNWDTALRWKAILAAIEWADAQQPVRRNTRERCLQLQREKLADADE